MLVDFQLNQRKLNEIMFERVSSRKYGCDLKKPITVEIRITAPGAS